MSFRESVKVMEKTIKDAFNIGQPSKETGTNLEDGSHTETATEAPKPVEEWVWVNGYKGTDKDMRCRGVQYEMWKRFDISDDRPVEMCEHGFHLCRGLPNVWRYYDVDGGNRFFEVNALVRKSDVDCGCDKYVAKSIIFVRELTADEILDAYCANCLSLEMRNEVYAWTEEQRNRILEIGIHKALTAVYVTQLESLGYSKPMASHIVNVLGMYETAYSVGTQEGLSMDMKIMAIYEEVIFGGDYVAKLRNSNERNGRRRHW